MSKIQIDEKSQDQKKKDGLQKKGDPPKTIDHMEGHSDPDIGARLSRQLDTSPVTANSLSLYRVPTPLSGWVTVTLKATDVIEGPGTWYFRIVTKGLANFSNPVEIPKKVIFDQDGDHKLILDPQNCVQTFGSYQMKVNQKSIGGASFDIELLRGCSDVTGHWGGENSDSYKAYKAKSWGEIFDKDGTKYLVMKRLSLSMSAIGPADVPIESPDKNPPKG